MPNSYFQFRQFRLEQDRCAMKMSTDACILGAYARHSTAERVLDIGTGSGLLSLMLAQRYPKAIIEGIEIDPLAAEQARENFDRSPWKDRLTSMEQSLIGFRPAMPYDLVICNPPFYNNQLISQESRRAGARHTTWMSYRDLTAFSHEHLSPEGRLWVLVPKSEEVRLLKAASEEQLQLASSLQISHHPSSPVHRCLIEFRPDNSNSPGSIHHMHIKETDGSYSTRMSELLGPFYQEYNFR